MNPSARTSEIVASRSGVRANFSASPAGSAADESVVGAFGARIWVDSASEDDALPSSRGASSSGELWRPSSLWTVRRHAGTADPMAVRPPRLPRTTGRRLPLARCSTTGVGGASGAAAAAAPCRSPRSTASVRMAVRERIGEPDPVIEHTPLSRAELAEHSRTTKRTLCNGPHVTATTNETTLRQSTNVGYRRAHAKCTMSPSAIS